MKTISQKGAIIVEFLLSLPLLLLVIAGVLDFGLSFREQAAIYETLRAAGRVTSSRASISSDPIPLEEFKTNLTEFIGSGLRDYGLEIERYQVEIEPFQSDIAGVTYPFLRLSARRVSPRTFFSSATFINFCARAVSKARFEPISLLPLEGELAPPCGAVP